ncbi:MAG: hypothetical protein IPL67_10840 [Ignavibacteria bacterium]|nr:hypothetical protein [Ignavibacteria bacterium]
MANDIPAVNFGISNYIEYNNITLASSVTSGWNIVSVPVRTSDMLYSTLFPGVASQAYTYSKRLREHSNAQQRHRLLDEV